MWGIWASKKEMFIGLLSAVMQSDIPGSCLEVWGNTGTKHTSTDMSRRCLHCGVPADTCGLLRLCTNGLSVYAACVPFVPMCLCACACVYCAAKLLKWHVRTLMSENRDTLSLINKPCQEEDLNNVPQLLYYSVFALGVMLLKSSTP